jgi:hypothetical protein
LYSPEQAGYAVTGGHFRYVTQTVYLRNPAGYAAELGGFGDSVQLWAGTELVVLGVSGTTGSGPYSSGIAVFNPATQATVCAEASCPGYSPAWAAGLSYPAGHTVTESLFYDQGSGLVIATVADDTAGTTTSSTYDAGVGVPFTQARAGVETGVTPWQAAPYTPPATVTPLARFSAVSFTSYSGHRGGITGQWWASHHVVQTAAGNVVQIAPKAVSGENSFGVFLRP